MAEAPALAKDRAILLPMPLVPPVIRMRWPACLTALMKGYGDEWIAEVKAAPISRVRDLYAQVELFGLTILRSD